MQWNYAKQKTVSLGLSLYEQKVFITKTAGELLFEGYQDDMIDIAREMPVIDGEAIEVPYDRFGWFYKVIFFSTILIIPRLIFFYDWFSQRNDTSNIAGHFNMYTGAEDISKIGQLKYWNYNDRTVFYPGKCGMVNGSAGEFYPPKQQKDKPISFFSPDMCRSIAFDFNEEVDVKGINGYKYSGGKRTVDNGTVYPETKCFSIGKSVPSGVMNVSSCRFGTPVFMSFPHYYAADPYYLEQIEGLLPDKEKHEFFMTLEPMSGIPLDVAARFQINMLIRPVTHIGLYAEAPEMFFPVLWFEQRVTITDDMAAEVQTLVSVPFTGYICCGILIAVGIVLLLWLPVARLISGPTKSQVQNDRDNEKGGRPEGSPFLEKNGNLRNVELTKFASKEDARLRHAPLAQRDAFCDKP